MRNLQGHLLVAAPRFIGTLPRAVVLVTEHTEEAATGVVLNHPVNEQILRTCLEMWQAGKTPAIALKMMQPQIPGLQITDAEVAGEPRTLPLSDEKIQLEDHCREEKRCHERRRDPHEIPGYSEEFAAEGLPLPEETPLPTPANGQQPQTIQLPVGVLMAPTGFIGGRMNDKSPPLFRVVVGQVAWQSADLEKELNQGHWLTTPATPELLFATHDDLWQTVVRRVGQEALFHGFGIKPALAVELN